MMNFTLFVRSLLPGLMAGRHYRKVEIYGSLLSSMARFIPQISELSLEEVYTPEVISDYKSFLTHKGCKHNTIVFYLSALRTAYKEAVDAGHLPFIHRLFSAASTKVAPTRKRALPDDVLTRVMLGDLSAKPYLEDCRKYFVLSSMLQGITFIDLAYLRPADLEGNEITLSRQKTESPVTIAVLEPAMEILKELMKKTPADSPYLLPIITLTGAKGHAEYNTAIHKQNRQLKALAKLLGITDKLTTYSTRHSWATQAYHGGVKMSVLSQCMGHRTEEVTRIYLRAFDADQLLHANMVVMQRILRPVFDGRVTDIIPEKMEYARKLMKIIDEYMESSPLSAFYPVDNGQNPLNSWHGERAGVCPGWEKKNAPLLI